MKEKSIIAIICIILIILALGINYFNFFYSDFNFYKAELTINGTSIKEKLYFNPDKDYHTLFRTFVDPILIGSSPNTNSILIKNVLCSNGNAYAYSNDGCFSFNNKIESSECLPYTEENEYGCGFGNEKGFKEAKNYWIEAEYELNQKNIFSINGKNYIKFVAYSPNNHIYLNTDKNLIIDGNAIYSDKYLTRDNAIIYVPYSGSLNEKVIVNLKNFEYDTSYFYYIIFFIFSLFPAIILYISWRIFGKEINELDVLNYISNYPKKRNGWEVAAFFKAPFGQLSNNLISSVLLSLYHKKIIDIKIEKSFFSENCFIKILKESTNLDWMEKEFLDILKFVVDKAKKDDFKDGYLNYEKASKRFNMQLSLPSKFRSLQFKLSKEVKNYISYSGLIVYVLFSMGLAGLSFLLGSIILPIFILSAFIAIMVLNYKTNLLTKFKKEEYFLEYKQWQSFKNYLNGSQSIRERGHKAVIMWDEYMIYAAALGVSKKVLKELRDIGVITDRQFNLYVSTQTFSTSIASSGHTSGSRGGSGGHSGAGGGGIGGGGGGGR